MVIETPRRETKFSLVGYKKRSKHKQMRVWPSSAIDSMTICSSSRRDSNRITYKCEHTLKSHKRRLQVLSKTLVMSARPFSKDVLRPSRCKVSKKLCQDLINSTARLRRYKIKSAPTKTSLQSNSKEVDRLKSRNRPPLQLPRKSSSSKNDCNCKKMLLSESKRLRNGLCST